MQTYLKSRPVWIQLLLFMGMAFGVFIVFSLVGVAILSNITGISILQLQNIDQWDSTDPNMIIYIRGMLIIQFLGLFVIPSLLFGYFSDSKPAEYLGLRQPHHAIYWVLGIAALLVSIPFVEYTGILNQKMIIGGEAQKWMKNMEEEAAKQIQFMLNKHTPKELLLNLIFISVFAGIGEELFFRGVLQRLFIKLTKSPWAGIILTAALFSGFHLQFYGFLPRLFLGVLLGALYWYSGSLWTAIIAHFIYDGLIIVIAYANPNMIKDPNATIVDPAQLSLMALVSAGLTFLVVWQMIKRSKTNYAAVYKDDKPPHDEFSF
ncbi:MAG: lysostaphin resistance A-like protein [Flavisolibacter sp.]